MSNVVLLRKYYIYHVALFIFFLEFVSLKEIELIILASYNVLQVSVFLVNRKENI